MSASRVRTGVFAAVRMAHRYPWRPSVAGAASVAVGTGVDVLGWSDPAMVLVPGGLAVTAGCTGWWWLRHVARPHSTQAQIARRAELDQRSRGTASVLDIIEHGGANSLRARAHILRPSLVALTRW